VHCPICRHDIRTESPAATAATAGPAS
jgi:hypothetical protein